MNSCKTDGKFSLSVLEAIDDGLLVLGEGGRFATYYQIEKRHGIKRDEIIDDLEGFHEALKGLFSTGAEIIERRIEKSLYEKLGLRFEENPNWTLINYVEYAKRNSAKAEG